MSKDTVLICGVNGYIAAVAAKHLLDSGYSVRGTVRRISSAAPLIEGPLKSYAEKGSFSVVEVPDFTTDGAFDEAVKDVTAIAHLASPVSFFISDPDPVIHAASSIAAVRNATPPPYTFAESDWNDVAEAQIAELGKDTPGRMIYAASQTAGEKAFWAFKQGKETSLHHDGSESLVITGRTGRSFVTGPPLIAPTTPSAIGETIKPIWAVYSGSPLSGEAAAGLGWTVDVRDVAGLILASITYSGEADGERYIASSASSMPQSIADVLRKAFPDAVGRIFEGTPGLGYRGDYQNDSETKLAVDGGKATKLLGVGQWVPY